MRVLRGGGLFRWMETRRAIPASPRTKGAQRKKKNAESENARAPSRRVAALISGPVPSARAAH